MKRSLYSVLNRVRTKAFNTLTTTSYGGYNRYYGSSPHWAIYGTATALLAWSLLNTSSCDDNNANITNDDVLTDPSPTPTLPSSTSYSLAPKSIFDKDLQMISRTEFLNFFGDNKPNVTVICILGGYNTGKSTLLNYLFFNKEQVFQASQLPCTRGMDACMITNSTWLLDPGRDVSDTPRMQQIERNYLVLDTEGLWSGKMDDVLKSFALQIYMMNIADIIVYNTHGSIKKSPDVEALEKLDTVIAQQQKEIAIQEGKGAIRKQQPALIMFANRDPGDATITEIIRMFNRFPLSSFSDFKLATSPDNSKPDDNSIRLNLSDLKIELQRALRRINTPKTTNEIYKQLEHIKNTTADVEDLEQYLNQAKEVGSTVNAFDMLDKVTCPYQCVHCDRRCEVYIWYKHFNHRYEKRQCTHQNSHGVQKTIWKCPNCNRQMNPVPGFTTSFWSKMGWGNNLICESCHKGSGWEKRFKIYINFTGPYVHVLENRTEFYEATKRWKLHDFRNPYAPPKKVAPKGKSDYSK